MKISSSKKAAILATVLSGFVLGSSAEAAKLGVVTASDYVTSHMGALEGSFINSDDIYAVKSVITGLNRDPAVYNTVDPVTGKSSVYIRQYNYSTSNLADSYAFDAQGNWKEFAVGNTSRAVNAHDVARYKDFVYVASYDEGTIGIAKVTKDNIIDLPKMAVNIKDHLERYAGITFTDANASLHGEGVVIVDGALYVIANCNPKGGYTPYDPSYLVKYVIQSDGSLSYDGYTTMGKNTDSVALNVYNNYMLTTAIGGYQYYGAENSNAETSINVATLHPEYNYLQSSRKINLPENLLQVRDGKTIPKSEFRSLKVMPNGTAYVMTYNIGRAGKNVDVTVYQTTVSNLLSSKPQNWKEVYREEAAPGWFGRLDAEYNTKRLWVQVGNKLNIYTDGATTPLSFGTDSFAANKMYEELYTWDIIRTDVIPEGNLVSLKLATGETKVNNNANVWKDVVGNVTKIENQGYKNIETKDNLINLGKEVEGNLTNNILAGIYAEDAASKINVYDGLQIQVENNIASPVGIYVGNSSTLSINSVAGNVNIITKTMDGGNTFTNAVWLDPSKTGGESMTIDAKTTNITMEGGYGGNGVAIQKTDRWGENSKVSAYGGAITINGDLNIKGTNVDAEGKKVADWGIGANPTNVLSRFNNAGILVDVNNSEVKVNGNVDMDVYGNGVTVNAEDATVTIAKGGRITVPTGTKYGYYALAAYDGTINMNSQGEANDVVLDGDIFATSEGTINLGLTTDKSKLNGIIDNGGTVNLTLQNGATWNNVQNNERYVLDYEDTGSGSFDEDGNYVGVSHVTNLYGGSSLLTAGTIVQKENSKLLHIDVLDGDVNVKYNHDKNNPTTIYGGEVKVAKATKNSNIALLTNWDGIKTDDEALINDVLDSLAHKLYYTEYVDGKRNLKGIVGLAEGLVASSVSRLANIKFDAATGQGSRSDGTSDDEGAEEITVEPPKHPGTDETDNPNAVWDTKTSAKKIASFEDGIVCDESTGDTTLKLDTPQVVKLQIQKRTDTDASGIYVTGGKSWIIDGYTNQVLGGRPRSHKLSTMNIISENLAEDGRSNAIWVDPSSETNREGIDFDLFSYKDYVNISVLGGYGGNGIAITQSDKTLNTAQGGIISIGKGTIRIKGEKYNEWGIGFNPLATDARENSAGILVDVKNSTVDLGFGSAVQMDIAGNGIVVDADGAKVVISKTAGTSTQKDASQILVPKGDLDYKFYSLAAYEGSIYLDVNETANKFKSSDIYTNGKIDGDMYVGEKGKIYAGLNGTNAYFNGAIITRDGAYVELGLLNGAKWTNSSTNGINKNKSNINGFYGSGSAQIVQTADSGDINIDNYSGNTNVYYSHDTNAPYKFYGGDVKINHATEGSSITLHTDYSSAIEWGNVENVLNSLANKLYYLDAINGEDDLSATVQIDEGLTGSKIEVQLLKNTEILDVNGELNTAIDNVKWNKDSAILSGEVQFDSSTGKGSLKELPKDGEEETPEIEWTEESVSPEYIHPKDFKVDGAYTKPIYGVIGKDQGYIKEGIRKNGVYSFTEDVSFNTKNNKIDSGAWRDDIGVAISAHGDLNNRKVEYKTVVDLNNHNLDITNYTDGSGASITAIDGGIVVIDNPGNITINETGYGETAGIFANSCGEIYINNTGDNVVTIRANAGGVNYDDRYAKSGVGIKTMNGAGDTRSKIVITGLVDVLVDATKGSNEGLSAVASTIDVGGGKIIAQNGAWAAIRAYGEFVSNNAGVVNVNVVKQTDADGNVIKDANDKNVDLVAGAGNNKTQIIGDFVTNGGMGTKGWISVGLNGADSYWYGNYADNKGYGVTKGMEGKVNLYMKNDADWTGFVDGDVSVTMEGAGTTWYGFNLADKTYFKETDAYGNEVEYYAGGLSLNLLDGATWVNAISTQQQNADGSKADSKVLNFIGAGGFIDMTGRETFLALNDANHAEGSDGLSGKNTRIQEYGDKYETGNLVITNYSGDTTVIYRRDANNITNVLGGTTTIKNATLGSKITLSTDGYGMSNNQVAETLDNLAEKLYYTAYINGERNLKGYVQIAEGLTTESVGKHVGSIVYNSATGQGSLNKDSLGLDVTPPSGGDEDDNTQGGGNEGGTGGTTPEKPEDKPVEPEKPVEPVKPPVEIGAPITGDNLENSDAFKNEAGNTIVKVDNEKGETVIDFGKLDVDKDGKEKPEHEHVGHVKIEPEKTSENASLISNAGEERQHYVLELDGKDLSLVGGTTGENKEAKGIEAVNGGVEIKNAGDINFTVEATGEGGKASAIYASGVGNDVIITTEKNGNKVDKVVKLSAKDNDKTHGVLHAEDKANVTIDGLVDITETNGKVAVNVGEGSTVTIAGGEIGAKDNTDKDVAVVVGKGGDIAINREGENVKVVINGAIHHGEKVDENVPQVAMYRLLRNMPQAQSEVERNWLTTSDSKMDGEVNNTTDKVAVAYGFTNGAKLNGNLVGIDADILLDEGSIWEGYYTAKNSSGVEITDTNLVLEIDDGAAWINTAEDDTVVEALKGSGGYIQMSENRIADDAGNERYVGLTIGEYSGNTTIMYQHDKETPSNILGGDVTISSVKTGEKANITLHTDSIGTSKQEEVKKVLDALAQKLTYDGKNDGKLTGKVQILEGMTTSSAMRTGAIEFDENGKGGLKDGSMNVEYKGDYIYGDSETAMMKGAKSAMASTVMMWRSESNDLLQRMGDVRLATEESGVWAKYYGGKYEMDAQKTNFTTSYKAYQVGYDKAVGNGWNVGVAVSHNEGDSHYDLGGEGEMTVTSLSVYGNKDYGDGRYLGLILKGSQLKNEYEVYNNDHYKLEGDYKTWGTSISAEYGKRIEKGNGFYFDPSVELTIGHVQGKDYTATSDLLKNYGKTATMQVEQDDFNSIIGRVGFGVGQRTDKASYYAKLALAHEFGGDFDTHYTAEETKGTNIDFGDTWYEMQLGGTAKLSDNSLLYATYERSFGGDVTEKWRVDAGLRVTF